MDKMQDAQKQLQLLEQGCVDVLPRDLLLKKLGRGTPLRIKLGADPTAPDLHLGHAVVLQKMRQFQDLGHQVIFLIGDFTARIGDPTGKSKTRPPLKPEDIERNSATYFQQVFRILDSSKTTIAYNSQWLAELDFAQLLQLCGKVTLARVIEREDFKNRIQAQEPIGFHELLYPLMQGYDSVDLKADVELGGTDQTFNLLMGRHLQEQFAQEGQVAMTLPILEGLDGVNKMSKSLGNYVGLSESPEQAYGKLMSLPDASMPNYRQLLLHISPQEAEAMRNNLATGVLHPMQAKKQLAFDIVERFWGRQAAEAGQTYFETTFQQKDFSLVPEMALVDVLSKPCWIVELLKAAKAVSSSSQAKSLIEAGAVYLDDLPVDDFYDQVTIAKGQVLKVGKKFLVRLV